MNAPANLPHDTATTRHDGWTTDRRRTFLELLAEGHTVEAACAHVGKSKMTAYALRRRDPGFALAWSAAVLRARDTVADILTSRAIDGQVHTLTLADGTTVTRHRYDNRLGLALLARLDRLAAQPLVSELGQPDEAAMRAAAFAFDALLDLVAQGEADADTVAAFIEPQIRKLRKLRVQEPTPNPPADPARPRIWYREGHGQYQTDLPPPPDFKGYQHGRYGDDNYWRVLSPAELERQKEREQGAPTPASFP